MLVEVTGVTVCRRRGPGPCGGAVAGAHTALRGGWPSTGTCS